MNDLIIQTSGTISEDLTERFLRLFPSWQVMIATFLALILLLIVFTRFLWKPIKKMHKERVDYIQDNIDSAKKANLEASKTKEDAMLELSDAKNKGAVIVENAIENSNYLRVQEIEKIRKETERMYRKASQNIEQDYKNFEEQKKEAIINVALDAARKVLEKEIDESSSKKIIDDYLKAK